MGRGRGGGAKLETVIAEPFGRSTRAVKSCELDTYVSNSHGFTARVDRPNGSAMTVSGFAPPPRPIGKNDVAEPPSISLSAGRPPRLPGGATHPNRPYSMPKVLWKAFGRKLPAFGNFRRLRLMISTPYVPFGT